MTQEQKAKAYDEAIKEAAIAYKDEDKHLKATLERIFPKLKESEDERIREGLIQYFKKFNLDTFAGIKPQDILSWLEKQGKETSWKPSKEEMDVLYGLAYITSQYDEHKEDVITRLYQDLKREFFNGSSYENMFPNTEDGVRRRSTIQVLEYARSLDTYNQYGKADIDKNIAWLEKQGQTFTKKDVDDAYLKGVCDTKHELEKQGEQKPFAWSKEDKGVLLESISVLQSSSRWVLADKLKSLKDRVLPQSQQEWSEEDEKMAERLLGWLDTLIIYIHHHDAIVSLDLRRERMQQVEQLKTWFKSLRLQSHWKPNNEQMEVLQWCMPLWNEPKTKAVLESLIADLKKL